MKWVLPAIITLLLFSIWAVFALTVINPYLVDRVPGYRIGRLCIWEFIALIISSIISILFVRSWGNVSLEQNEKEKQIKFNYKYAVFLVGYLILMAAIGIWQFWKFSQTF